MALSPRALASDRAWCPEFFRVPSEADVSDAVKRGDDSRTWREGWRRAHAPVDEVMMILARAAGDVNFACHGSPDPRIQGPHEPCAQRVGHLVEVASRGANGEVERNKVSQWPGPLTGVGSCGVGRKRVDSISANAHLL